MMTKASDSATYSRWLKSIVDTHMLRIVGDRKPTDASERDDEELNDLWAEARRRRETSHLGLVVRRTLNTLRDGEK